VAKRKLFSTLDDLVALTSPAVRSQLTLTIRESNHSGLLHNPHTVHSGCPNIKVLPKSRSAGRLQAHVDTTDITITVADLIARSADYCECLKGIRVQSLLRPTTFVVGTANPQTLVSVLATHVAPTPRPTQLRRQPPTTTTPNDQACEVLVAALHGSAELARYNAHIAAGTLAKTTKQQRNLEYQADKLTCYNPALFDTATHTLLCDLLSDLKAAISSITTTRVSTPVKDDTLALVRKTLIGDDEHLALDDTPTFIAIRPPRTGRRRTKWSTQVELLFEQFAIRQENALVVLVAPLYVYEFLVDRPDARKNGLMPCAIIASTDTAQVLELAAGLWDPQAKGGLQSPHEALSTARLLATVDLTAELVANL
jgi:hypothetical protein